MPKQRISAWLRDLPEAARQNGSITGPVIYGLAFFETFGWYEWVLPIIWIFILFFVFDANGGTQRVCQCVE